LPAGDIIDRGDGIRVTSAARTLFDQAKHVDGLTLISIGEQILDLELATVVERVTDTAIAANLSGVVGELVGLYIQRRHQVGIGRSARGA